VALVRQDNILMLLKSIRDDPKFQDTGVKDTDIYVQIMRETSCYHKWSSRLPTEY
jgi:hypothetical protein